MLRALIVGAGLEPLTHALGQRLDDPTGVRWVPEWSEAEASPDAMVVVVSDEVYLGAEPSRIAELRSQARHLVFLNWDDPKDSLPAEVLGLESSDFDEMAERLRSIVLASRLNLHLTDDSRCFVGDIALLPILTLIRHISLLGLTGQLEFVEGRVDFEDGNVVSARVGATRGMKAFCRLGRRRQGSIRFFLDVESDDLNIGMPVELLILRAIEDAQVQWQNPRERIRLLKQPNETDQGLPDYLKEVVKKAQEYSTLGAIINAIPIPDGLIMQRLESLVALGWLEMKEPQQSAVVVSDSSGDLSNRRSHELAIRIAPLSIIFGDEIYEDGNEINSAQFYGRVNEGGVHPSTAPPSVDDFYDLYDSIPEEQDIVSIHISRKMSETLNHAKEARRKWVEAGGRRDRIRIVNSSQVSAGLGLLTLLSGRMAARDQGANEIMAFLEAAIPRCHLIFAVDTLDYLVRGGRIGKAKGFIGNLFDIKPILAVIRGEVSNIGKVRGRRRMIPKLIDEVAARQSPDQPMIAIVAHANAPGPAHQLMQRLEESFEVAEIALTDIGPVVGSHTGPGCTGVVFFQPTPEEWNLISPLGS